MAFLRWGGRRRTKGTQRAAPRGDGQGERGAGPNGRDRAKDPGRPAAEMTDEELLEAVARRIAGRGLAVPAVFFLESTKPLSFVGSQALIFLQPFVEAFLTIRNYERFAALLENRENVEHLIQRMEALEEEGRAARKQARAKEKEARAREGTGGERDR